MAANVATLHVPGAFNLAPDSSIDDSKIQRITRFPAAQDFRSPTHPPASLDSWQDKDSIDSIPPPYDTTELTDNTKLEEAGVFHSQNQHPRDWAYDASRTAARNAFARQKRISFHNTARQKSKRKQKPFGQTLRPGIKVDTSFSNHRGAAPQQLFPRASEKGDAVICISASELMPSEEREPTTKFKWMRKLGLGGKKEGVEKSAPAYEFQQTQPDRTPIPYDNGFRFKSKTLRANPPQQQPRSHPLPVQQPPVPPVPAADPRTLTFRNVKELNPARLTLSDISPSDRPITIGLSVSPEQASEYQASPQSANVNMYLDTQSPSRRRSASGASVDTPTIVVTPAQETSGWLMPPTTGLQPPRPASSVYSRTTNYFTVYNSGEDVPPVPPVPAHLANAKNGDFYAAQRGTNVANAFIFSEPPRDLENPTEKGLPYDTTSADVQTGGRKKKERITSAGTEATVFEEDLTPASAKSDVKGPNGLYVDTNIPPTPRRSRGWWNIITTPFEMTPLRWRFSPSSEASTPDVPTLPTTANFVAVQRQPSVSRGTTNNREEQSPASASTAFSTATWERESPYATPRLHDDLGIYRAPDFASTPSPPVEKFHEEADDQPPQVLVAGEQGSEPAKGDSAPPETTKEMQGQQDVYTPNHYSYHQNGIPFHRSDRPVTRSGTLKSTDTTPVVAVASLGTVLSARAVHEPHNSNAEHFDGGRIAAVETATPPMAPADPRPSAERRPSAPHDISLPYFAPPPTYPQPDYPQHSYGQPAYGHAQDNTQQSTAYAAAAAPSPRGGTKRPFPKKSRAADKEKPAKSAKPARQKGAGGYWSLMKLFKRRKDGQGAQVETNPKKRKRRRWCCWCCILFLILLIIMAALLGTLLPRSHHKSTETQTQWLNLTGYPPIPTGVATIARPDNNYAQSGCVSPSTMWSCAVPKEEQDDLSPNEPNQPNFKLEITFVNGTVSNTSALQIEKRSVGSRLFRLLRRDDAPTADPAAPSDEDQNFLGNTTDGNSQPFEGEETPFFITFLTGDHVSSRRLIKRADEASNSSSSSTTTSSSKSSTTSSKSSATSSSKGSSSTAASSSAASSTSSSSGSIASYIPAPAESSDGTAADANLLFFPENQPLRLYNRGQDDEHYGFYNYYDRSIFLENNIVYNSSDTGELASDADGGSTKANAKVRCTWRQTRYLVQIWTNTNASKSLLPAVDSTSTSTASASSATSTSSSSTDFNRPGSFPYPVTITLDRHGGNVTEKEIYCYGMEDEKIIESDAKFQLEDRDFGGTLVNPAQGPYGNVTVSVEDGGPGGIDGGTGGCSCQYRNWEQA